MSEINLKEIEFIDELLANVRLFDRLLAELGEPPLFENPNFQVLSGLEVVEHYLVMETTHRKSNALPLMIWFEIGALRIDIDKTPETFEWGRQDIIDDEASVLGLLRVLFTGYVLIDYEKGSRFLQIFDRQGDFVDSRSYNNWFHMLTGRFLFRFKDYRKLYLPLFSKD